jgi:hypothetical protein
MPVCSPPPANAAAISNSLQVVLNGNQLAKKSSEHSSFLTPDSQAACSMPTEASIPSTMLWPLELVTAPEANEPPTGEEGQENHPGNLSRALKLSRSTCDLEIDLHVSHILNLHMVKGRFGAELWEEENSRRKRRGLNEHSFPTPPYTLSRHLPMNDTELDFRQRLKNLYVKGKALNATESSRAIRRLNSLSQNFVAPQSSPTVVIGVYDSTSNDDHDDEQLSSPQIQSWLQQVDDQETVDIAYGAILSQAFLSNQQVLQQVANHDRDETAETASPVHSDDDDSDNSDNEPSEPLNRKSRAKKHQEIVDILSSTQDGEDQSSLAIPVPAVKALPISNANGKAISHSDLPTSAVVATTTPVAIASSSASQVKRKMKMSSAFSSKKRKRVMFADLVVDDVDPVARLASSSDNPRSTNTPEKDGHSSTAATVVYSPSADDFISNQTQGSPIYVNNSSQPTLLLIPSYRPPKSSELRDLSYYNRDPTINLSVHVSVRADLHSSSSNGREVSCRTPQQAVLNRRREMIKCLGDNAQFDGGYVSSDAIDRTIQTSLDHIADRSSSMRHDQINDDQAQANPSQESIDDTDKNVILQIDAADERIWQQEQQQKQQGSKYTNILSKQAIYLAMRFDGALEAFKEVLSAVEEDALLAAATTPSVTRYLIPTFKPPSARQLRQCYQPGQVSIDSHKMKQLHQRTHRRIKYKKSQIATPSPTNQLSSTAAAKSLAMNLPIDPTFPTSSTNLQQAYTLKSRLVMLSIEVCCRTRKNLLPNPKYDAVQLIAWCAHDSVSNAELEDKRIMHGILMFIFQPQTESVASASEKRVQLMQLKACTLSPDSYVHIDDNEYQLYQSFIRLVQFIDPDILLGYEVQNSSLGYIIARAKHLGIDMLQELSRLPTEKASRRNEYDEYAQEHESGIFITGRIIFNIWRRMRSELKLMSYSRNNVAEQLLQARLPAYSHEQLTRWLSNPHSRHLTIEYCHLLAQVNLQFLDKLDLIYRLSESARLYGIDLFSVVSRGSQYRVEASLLIQAHYAGYILITPSRRQVANQAAMACIPLVMEPHPSKFYHDPVIVLDFQSLYPSMIIAYNLCYSTCLGKLLPGQNVNLISPDTPNRLGVIDYPEKLSANSIYKQQSLSEAHIAPNGSVFCSKDVREGILPIMLREILNTRVMVKKSMKEYSGDEDRVLRRVLDARQLAIKLLANVTCKLLRST